MLVEEAQRLYARMEGGWRRVLLAHWSVEGAALPNGLPVADLKEVVLPLVELEAIGFDAIVLGHIHRAQMLSGDTKIFYVGSPACVDFGEANVEHGCTIIEFYDDQGRQEVYGWKRHALEDRPFVTLDFQGPHDADMLPGTDWTASERLDGAVVRVRYTATEEQARRVDHAALTRALLDAGARKVVSIQSAILREGRQRDERVDESLDPLSALALYAERQDWTPSQLADANARTEAYLTRVTA
jgi:DNA repair exonuclease SbcCD nuclease subunit